MLQLKGLRGRTVGEKVTVQQGKIFEEQEGGYTPRHLQGCERKGFARGGICKDVKRKELGMHQKRGMSNNGWLCGDGVESSRLMVA